MQVRLVYEAKLLEVGEGASVQSMQLTNDRRRNANKTAQT